MIDKPWWLLGPLPAVGFSIGDGKKIDFSFGSGETRLGWQDVSGSGNLAYAGVWNRLLTTDEVLHLMASFTDGCQCELCAEGRLTP